MAARPAYCEDYDEEMAVVQPGTRTSAWTRAPGKPTKYPAGVPFPQAQAARSLANSDSGYSSMSSNTPSMFSYTSSMPSNPSPLSSIPSPTSSNSPGMVGAPPPYSQAIRAPQLCIEPNCNHRYYPILDNSFQATPPSLPVATVPQASMYPGYYPLWHTATGAAYNHTWGSGDNQWSTSLAAYQRSQPPFANAVPQYAHGVNSPANLPLHAAPDLQYYHPAVMPASIPINTYTSRELSTQEQSVRLDIGGARRNRSRDHLDLAHGDSHHINEHSPPAENDRVAHRLSARRRKKPTGQHGEHSSGQKDASRSGFGTDWIAEQKPDPVSGSVSSDVQSHQFDNDCAKGLKLSRRKTTSMGRPKQEKAQPIPSMLEMRPVGPHEHDVEQPGHAARREDGETALLVNYLGEQGVADPSRSDPLLFQSPTRDPSREQDDLTIASADASSSVHFNNSSQDDLRTVAQGLPSIAEEVQGGEQPSLRDTSNADIPLESDGTFTKADSSVLADGDKHYNGTHEHPSSAAHQRLMVDDDDDDTASGIIQIAQTGEDPSTPNNLLTADVSSDRDVTSAEPRAGQVTMSEQTDFQTSFVRGDSPHNSPEVSSADLKDPLSDTPLNPVPTENLSLVKRSTHSNVIPSSKFERQLPEKLEPRLSQTLTSWFAEHVIEGVSRIRIPGDSIENPDCRAEDSLGIYARLLLMRASSKFERQAALFVLETKVNVARHINHALAGLAQHSTEPRNPSAVEKLDLLWGPNQEGLYDDQGAGQTQTQTEAPSVDIRQAHDYLLGGDEFTWLVRRIMVATSLSSSDDARTQVANELCDAIGSSGKLTIELDWAPVSFLQEQYEGSRDVDLEDVICIWGSAVNAQASTCVEGVKQMWPELGPQVLNVLSDATKHMQGKHQGNISPAHVLKVQLREETATFECVADPVMLLEVAEILIWLGTVCRCSWQSDNITYCQPRITGTDLEGSISVEYVHEEIAMSDQRQNGQCWKALFRNPVIGRDYPVRARQAGDTGLEISLLMMTVLGQTPLITTFAETTILKGFSSLFVLTAYSLSSATWHFICEDSRRRLPYERGLLESGPRLLDSGSMECSRHFVGWTTAADVLAGSKLAIYDVKRSQSDASKPALATLSSINISFSKVVGLGATLARGKKDIPAALASSRIYEEQVESAGEWNVIFYDTLLRRGWLVDGTTALLHLSRAWLSTYSCRQSLQARANNQDIAEGDILDQFRDPPTMEGRESALLTLYNDENRDLRLYTKGETKEETTRDLQTGRVTRAEKVTKTWWCWEQLVQEKWSILEQIHDHLVRKRQSPSTDIRLPFGKQSIEGYEFRDIVQGISPLLPRITKLEDSAGAWLDLAHAIDAITIFGSDFGDLLKPASVFSGRASQTRCGRQTLCPEGQDYLAAPLSVLDEISQRYRQDKEGQVQLGDTIFWSDTLLPLEKCGCSDGMCSVNVARLHVQTAPMLSSSTTPRMQKHEVFKRYGRGAVLFGHQQARLRSRRAADSGESSTRKSQRKLERERVADSGIDMGDSSSGLTTPSPQVEEAPLPSKAKSARPVDSAHGSSRLSSHGTRPPFFRMFPAHASKSSRSSRVSDSTSSVAGRGPSSKKSLASRESAESAVPREQRLDKLERSSQRSSHRERTERRRKDAHDSYARRDAEPGKASCGS